jgi:nickel/cobalt exporter
MHALEPGHAKTLTAAYLIGIKGTRRDAALLGLSVAVAHSFVVVALSVCAVMFGREAFTERATHWLEVISACAVIGLGAWLLRRRLRAASAASRPHAHAHHALSPVRAAGLPESLTVSHHHDDHEHDHDLLGDEEHARAHMADLPDYARRGERPTFGQIVAFGAAGGLTPCPAAVSVMLLSLSVSNSARGLILVAGFSIGLAITLVAVGLAVVTGVTMLGHSHSSRLAWLSKRAPLLGAALVIVSGVVALVITQIK